MTKIVAHNQGEHYKTVLRSESHTIIADEPIANGGKDEGFNPIELLQSALASCTCITLRMYADRKGWKLENVETEINFVMDNETKVSRIERNIKLTGNLLDEEKQRLLFIAEKCFIHKVLTNDVEINTILK
jgi:putative redox protein